MVQFSMLLFDECKMRLKEIAKYFPFKTISFFMSVILPDRLYKLKSNTGSIFVDSFFGGWGVGVGILTKICWENPNLFKTEQKISGTLHEHILRLLLLPTCTAIM